MSNSNINYYFRNKKTLVNVTPRDWNHYYDLQGNRDYEQITMYQLDHQSKRVLPIDYWNSRNRFWQGAIGFEKIGQLKCSGFPYGTYLDTIRLFLQEVHNHACMQGDAVTAVKVEKLLKFFYVPSAGHNGIHTKLLTA